MRDVRYITFQLAEVAILKSLFANILSLIDDLRPRPDPAQAEEIHGEVETTGEVRLDDDKIGRMGFWTPSTDENRAIRKAEAENHSNDGAIWVTSPWKPSYLGYIGLTPFTPVGFAAIFARQTGARCSVVRDTSNEARRLWRQKSPR